MFYKLEKCMSKRCRLGRDIEVYYLGGYCRAPCEDMWEHIRHPALFTSKKQFEKWADYVLSHKEAINLSNWILPTSPASYIRNKTNPKEYLV